MSQRNRPRIPAHVKLQAALLSDPLPAAVVMEELPGERVEWDHEPPLASRDYDPVTGLYTPDANDPRHITPMTRSDHARKTNGNGATTAGSDKQKIAKAKRTEKARLAEEAAAAESDEAAFVVRKALTSPKPRRDWGHREIPSRPFPANRRSKRNK